MKEMASWGRWKIGDFSRAHAAFVGGRGGGDSRSLGALSDASAREIDWRYCSREIDWAAGFFWGSTGHFRFIR